ncbi:MAG: hypothetical protein GY705_29525 [Bacteroidetes bacterium]|nr:hypothetical protein [Bacteroidota bacterium]
MKYFFYLIFLAIFLLNTSCDPDKKGTNNDNNTTTDKTTTEQKPEVISKEKSKYRLALITGQTTYEEESSIPSTAIYLTSPQFPEAVLLIDDYDYAPLDKVQWKEFGIPANVTFAFQSWFAGGGANYYGIAEGSKVKLFRQYIDEGDPEAEEIADLEPFELIKTVDLDNKGMEPGYYICYNEDNNPSLKLSIYFNADGRATALKYKGQTDFIPLQFIGEEMNTEGMVPSLSENYIEIFEGKENGKFTLTHSGNWDYASYTRKKDGKKFDFTIAHDLTVINDSYRITPCYE